MYSVPDSPRCPTRGKLGGGGWNDHPLSHLLAGPLLRGLHVFQPTANNHCTHVYTGLNPSRPQHTCGLRLYGEGLPTVSIDTDI